LRLVDQQEHARDQERQHHIDHAIQQQGSGQWCGAELVCKCGEQDRFEHPDSARYVAEHASGEGQQVNQQEWTEGRRFWQQ